MQAGGIDVAQGPDPRPNRGTQLESGLPLKRADAVRQFVQHDAQGPDIGRRLRAPERATARAPCRRRCPRRCLCSMAVASNCVVSSDTLRRSASPKSSTFTRPAGVTITLAFSRSAMQDAAVVRVAQRFRQLHPVPYDLPVGNGPIASRELSVCPSTSSIAMGSGRWPRRLRGPCRCTDG